MKPKIFAFYLPQFHPIEDNNRWYGPGFTEWTNVAKAKPLFKGHEQPKIPADLGFYDLRLPEVRQAQVDLAKEAGIDAFCYYHYWFGGKQIMEYVLNDIVKRKEPDFPFCVCWANMSWFKKEWDPSIKTLRPEVILDQVYPGDEDIIKHFNMLLPIFQDSRYYKIDGKLVFFVYQIQLMPNFAEFKAKWDKLAEEHDLPGFYYLTYTTNIEDVEKPIMSDCDGVVLSLINHSVGNDRNNSRILSYVKTLRNKAKNYLHIPQNVVSYADAIKKLTNPIAKKDNVIPVLVPNWDHTARRGYSATVMHKSTPELFKKHCRDVFELVKDKPDDKQIIFLKSWNEWAEGNYMEPDIVHGKGYIKALREVVEEYKDK
ncbi:MAG: glycoside hydrolase family 99-like domain-containing protein [Bacteroidaceae bacterium]